MTQKTESKLAVAFAIAAAFSVGIGVMGAVLPRGPAPAVATVAAAELPNCPTAGCWR